MSRLRMAAGAVGAAVAVAGLTTAGAGTLAQASAKPADTILAGSTVPFTAGIRATGDVAGSQRLTIELWLKPRQAAAARFATAVSTPGSPLFHRYLSPAGYAARFGATRGAASKVESWLRSRGFTAIRADAQRTYVRATAPTSKINAAFRVRLKLYKSSAAANAGRYALRANDRPLSMPASLAGRVLGVTGLDNAAPILPLIRQNARPAGAKSGRAAPGGAKSGRAAPGGNPACSQYYGQHKVTGLPEQFGTTTFPTEVCGYSAGQLRAAYGANMTNTGRGQTIALVELGLARAMFLTLKDYAAASKMPAPSTRRYAELSLGENSCGDPFNIEEQTDVESSYDMAPGASQLVVGGDSCNTGDFGLQGLFNADMAVLDGSGGHPLATVVSNSWEVPLGELQPVSFTKIEHAFLTKAAAEGVGMYFSSGDSSGVLAPSDDPFAIAVGGTAVGIGKTGSHLFETGWSTGSSLLSANGHRWIFVGEQGAAGGGPSLLWRQPGYQRGVVPPALAKAQGSVGGPARSVPDISADADPFTGMAVGLLTFKKGQLPTFGEQTIGGTSVASPLVAGIVTAAQAGQPAAFGFADPAIYKLAGTDAYHDTLPLTRASSALYRGTACDAATCGDQILTIFDDQNPNMFGYTGQVTLPGYDNMSGVGTPNGLKFIIGLRSLEG
jgi:subtilase family serine protease